MFPRTNAANGYAFGLLIQEVPPEVAIWTLVYTPVEVLAFASGGSVGLLAAVNAWALLRGEGGVIRWRTLASVAGWSYVGIALAGVLESIAMKFMYI